MRLESTIRRMMWDYPSLFKNRSKAIEHLFIVNGNGFEWKNGQIVNVFPEKKRSIDYVLELGSFDSFYEDLDRTQGFGKKIWEDYQARKRIDKKHAICRRTLVKQFSQRKVQPRAVYPLCEYAKLLTLPDDIQPDWLRGAQEAEVLVRHTTESVYQYMVGKPDHRGRVLTQDQADAAFAEQMKWADKVHARISELVWSRFDQDTAGRPLAEALGGATRKDS